MLYHSTPSSKLGIEAIRVHLKASDHGEQSIWCSCVNRIITVNAISECALVWYRTRKCVFIPYFPPFAVTALHDMLLEKGFQRAWLTPAIRFSKASWL